MKTIIYKSTFILLFLIITLTSQQLFAQLPVHSWSIGVGSTLFEVANDIAVDAQGNTYSTGFFKGTADFDPGPGTHNLTSNGNSEIYILKTDSAGNFVWAKSMGSAGNDIGASIVVSPSGYIYVTGYFSNTVDFDPGPGVHNLVCVDGSCNTDLFILKLDTNGNFVWVKAVEGLEGTCTSFTDVGWAIDLDQSENVYVAGQFQGRADFNPSPAPADTFFIKTANGSSWTQDVFVLKLDNAGNFKWAKSVGNARGDIAYGINVSNNGGVYVTGMFYCLVDFDPGVTTDTLVGHGCTYPEAFIFKLDTVGNYLWSKNIGGSADDRGYAITTDNYGNVYATGYFNGTADLDPSSTNTNNITTNNGPGIYIVKLSDSGNHIWSKALTGTVYGGERSGSCIVTDINGDVYVTGHFTTTVDFNPSQNLADTFNLSAGGSSVNNTDAYILKLDSSGNFSWATNMGTTGIDRGKSIVVDDSFNIYSTGYYAGTVDFDPGNGISNLTSVGSTDIYIQKLSQNINVGITQNNLSSIKIYPNPTQNQLIIDSNQKITNVTIINISGKVLKTVTNIKPRINVSNLNKGVYFIRIKTINGIFTHKMIKL